MGLVDKARLLLGALRPAYWQALAVVALLYFARFDAGFATLRARTVRRCTACEGGCLGWAWGVALQDRAWLPACVTARTRDRMLLSRTARAPRHDHPASCLPLR